MAYSIDRMPERISIGRETETGVTDVMIDCGAWVDKWPGMALHAIHTPEGGAPYILQTETVGSVLVWHVTDADTATPGTGSMEIVGEMDGRRKVSATVKVSVAARMSGTVGEPPEAAKPWADRVVEAAERITGMQVQATTLDVGIGATAEWDGQHGLLTIGVPKGEQGPKGEKGEKGEPGKDAVVDATLTQSGQAADAKVTGDAIGQLKGDIAGKLPKSPANWEPWTADEQAAARERMGIPGDYELIEEITLEEDTALFMRDAEPDGTSYNFKNVVVLITSAKTAVGNKTIYTRIHSGDKSQSTYCIFVENLNYYKRAVWRAKIENSELRFASIETTYVYSAQNAVSGDTSAYKESPNCNIVNDNITKIEISCSDNIPVGFLIQIFGVRA